MKNIKKIAFYSILSFSILKISCGNEHMHERAAKILANAGLEATEKTAATLLKISEIASASSAEVSQKVGVEAAKIVAVAGLEATTVTTRAALDAAQLTADAGIKVSENAVKISENAITASEKFGSEAAKIIAPVAGVAVIIYGVNTVADLGSRLYDYNNPDEEKISRLKQAQEINEYIDARRAFRTCLRNNIKTQRNSEGIPTACEEAANMFLSAAGGRDEFDKMIEIFKSFYQK